MSKIDEHRKRGMGYYRGVRRWTKGHFDVLNALTLLGESTRKEIADELNCLRKKEGRKFLLHSTYSGFLSELLGDGYVAMHKTDGKETWTITKKGMEALKNEDRLLSH